MNLKSLIPYTSLLLIAYLANSVLAKPLEEYCISQLTPEQAQFEEQNIQHKNFAKQNFYEKKLSRIAAFSRGESKFIVETDGLNLELRKEGEQKVIQELRNFVQKDEWISYIFITKDNWLFAHADFNNYMIDLNTPESTLGFKKPIKIPYYGVKCNRWKIWFDGGCSVSAIYHSQTIGGAIISGYHPTDSGQKRTTVEIVAGEIKVIESPKPIGNIAADLPEFGGTILRTVSNGALFYDGKNITELELDLPKKRFGSKYPSWTVKKIGNYGESKKNQTNQRIYITNLRFSREDPNFVIELQKKAEVYTKKILFAANVNEQNLSQAFLLFPGESRKWGTTNNSILFEISGEYQTVLKIPKGYYIPYQLRTIPHIREIRKGNNNSLDEPAIIFDVVQEESDLSTTYYIKRVTSFANCDATLDPNNPAYLVIN